MARRYRLSFLPHGRYSHTLPCMPVGTRATGQGNDARKPSRPTGLIILLGNNLPSDVCVPLLNGSTRLAVCIKFMNWIKTILNGFRRVSGHEPIRICAKL